MSQIDKEATSKAGQSLQRSQKSQPRIAKVGVLLWLETQNLTLIGSQKYTKSLKYQGSLYHFLCRKHIFNGSGHFSWIASIMAPTTIQLIQWVEVSSYFVGDFQNVVMTHCITISIFLHVQLDFSAEIWFSWEKAMQVGSWDKTFTRTEWNQLLQQGREDKKFRRFSRECA